MALARVLAEELVNSLLFRSSSKTFNFLNLVTRLATDSIPLSPISQLGIQRINYSKLGAKSLSRSKLVPKRPNFLSYPLNQGTVNWKDLELANEGEKILFVYLAKAYLTSLSVFSRADLASMLETFPANFNNYLIMYLDYSTYPFSIENRVGFFSETLDLGFLLTIQISTSYLLVIAELRMY